MVESSHSATSLIARADKYLNTGSGEYASEIMRDMAEFIRRLPNDAQAPGDCGALEDLVSTFEQMRGYPEGDSTDPCFDLCGTPCCNEFGCLHAKVRAVRALTLPSTKRDSAPWDAHHNRSYAPVETRAKEIYDFFEFKESGTKPEWVPGGNSLMQDEARICARKQLRDAGHTPSRASPPRETPHDR